MAADNIKVAIKVRPILKRDRRQQQTFWKVLGNSIQLNESQSDPFYFDHIFNEDATNQEIFETMAKPIVHAALRGFNGTIFAYGQTSSGKTYTMLGDDHNPGVMISAVREIFNEIEKAKSRKFLIRVGYIEIYNEKIFDLLDKKNHDIKIHENGQGEVSVNCTDFIIQSEQDMLFHLQSGNKARKIGETLMNERSSRSHAIFRIIIESEESTDFNQPTDESAVQISHLNLVDLAGSERADQTRTTGSRLKEGCHINKSLLSLSLVIKNLSENESDKFINYRDSKLTRILQASLGGNALTAIICTITSTTIEETNSTLSFAMRAKSIKNKPQKNEVLSDAAMMKRLAKEISRLQNELEVEKSKNSKIKIIQLEKQIQDAELKIVHFTDKNRLRRRTWCSSSSSPGAVSNNGLSNGNKIEKLDEKFERKAHQFMTPLIPFREYPQNATIVEEEFIPAEELKFDFVDQRNINELFTPTKNHHQVVPLNMSLTPVEDARTKYKKLLSEYEELKDFLTLEKDCELRDAAQKITELENERKRLADICDDSFAKEIRLERSQQRCQELESRISELTEKVNSLECQHNKYHIEIDEHQQKIKSLLMASSGVEDVKFEFDQYKEQSKKREVDLVDQLSDRDKKIERLEKQLKDTFSSRTSDHENSIPCVAGKGSNMNYDENVSVNQSDSSISGMVKVHFTNSNGIDSTNSVTNASESIEDFRRQLDHYKNVLQEKEKLLNDLHTEITKIKSEHVKTETENIKLSDEMMDYVHQNDSLTRKCQEYEEKLKSTLECNEQLKDKIQRELENSAAVLASESGDSEREIVHKTIEYANSKSKTETDENQLVLSIVEEIIANSLPPYTTDDDEAINNSQTFNNLASLKLSGKSESIEQLQCELSEKISTYEYLNKELKEKIDALNLTISKVENRNVEIKDTLYELNSSQSTLKCEQKNDRNSLSSTNKEDIDSLAEDTSQDRSALEVEISELKKQIEEITENKQHLDVEHSRLIESQKVLSDQMDVTQSELSELRKQKNHWEKLISQAEEEIAMFKEQVKELEHQLKETRCEKQTTKERLVHLEETRSEFKVEIDKHIHEISSLEQKNAKLSESLKELESMKIKLEEQNGYVNQELVAKNSIISNMETINNKQLETHKQLQDEKGELEKQINLKSRQIDELTVQIENVREEQNKLLEILKSVSNEKVEYVKEKNNLNQKIEALKCSNDDYKKSISELEANNQEMKTARKELENQVKEYLEVINQLHAEISSIKEEKTEVEEKLKDSQGTFFNLEKTYEELKLNDDKRSSEVSNLMDINTKLEKQIDELKLNKAKLTNDYETIENEKHNLKAALGESQYIVQTLEAEYNSLKQSRKNAAEQVNALQEERDELLQIKEQMENEFQRKLVDECELTIAELTNVRSQNFVLIDKIESVIAEKDELQTLLNKNVTRTKCLEKELTVLTEKVDKLQELNMKMEEKCSQADLENEELNIRISEYERSKTEMEKEIKRLRGEQESVLARQQEQFEKANAKLSTLKEELEAQMQQFTNLRKENEDLKQQIAKTATETCLNDSATREKDEILKQLHEMQKMHVYKIKQYQQEIKKLRSQISEISQQSELGATRCKNICSSDAETQKIKSLLGENDVLKQKNQSLTAELQESRKLAEKDRKIKRHSNHDESRSLQWLDNRDICTMTDPTDELCNCERLDKEITEAKKNLLIKDCQINTLRMQLKHNPLRDECERLKGMLMEDEAEKREMRKDLNKLRTRISELHNLSKSCDQCIRRSRTTFVNQYSQTIVQQQVSVCTEHPELESELTKLRSKYEDLKRLCRFRNSKITELEQQLSIKENEHANRFIADGATTEGSTLQSLKKELTVFKKKYSEAKLIVGFRDKRIQDLEAALAEIKNSR